MHKQVTMTKTERQDFNGHWDDLAEDFARGKKEPIRVTFEETFSPKGSRAANVRRIDWPNNAA
jgi:hypothetical protein